MILEVSGVSVTTMSVSLVRTNEEPKGDESVPNSSLQACQIAVANPGRGEGACAPPGPVKISHKRMATKGGSIDFMFLAPHPCPPPNTGRWIHYHWQIQGGRQRCTPPPGGPNSFIFMQFSAKS